VNIIPEKNPARDASGVPTELRELLGLLAELAEMPPTPAGSNWDRYREVEGKRQSMVRVLLGSLNSTLTVHARVLAEHPDIAEQELGKDCRRWVSLARERLAEPLGYEPKPEAAEDGAK
jgi:hypothetical protein